ncbi:MAG: TetR/AcrR family transcriptional regulator C-terminal domain-containing protein [Lachnospiraceae bacterium]|nr:TetR/AcrR family transcriptional regulator C-terminal domain-containing protein [Lachnospiraceae bacterium]
MTRKEATSRTKQAMADSLKKLACQKSFSQITIRDIIVDCNINRKTFYYHFEDIYDLLKWTLEQEAISVVKNFDLLAEYEEALNFVLDYVDENRDFLHSVSHSLGRSELKRFFYNDFIDVLRIYIDAVEQAEQLNVSAEFKNFISAFFSEAVAGSILSSIDQPEKQDRQRIAGYIMIIIDSTIPATLRAASQGQA